MTAFTAQPHAAMDMFPAFLASIRSEFPDDCEAIADEMIDAELGDFCWESRIAERRLGLLESSGMMKMRPVRRSRSWGISAAGIWWRPAFWTAIGGSAGCGNTANSTRWPMRNWPSWRRVESAGGGGAPAPFPSFFSPADRSGAAADWIN